MGLAALPWFIPVVHGASLVQSVAIDDVAEAVAAAVAGRIPAGAVVDLVEPMGSDTLVWLDLGGQPLAARVESSETHKPDEKVKVSFRAGLASLFDATSGDRL